MNMPKTKTTSNARVVPTPVNIGDCTLEVVDDSIPGTNCPVRHAKLREPGDHRSQVGRAAFWDAAPYFLIKYTTATQSESL